MSTFNHIVRNHKNEPSQVIPGGCKKHPMAAYGEEYGGCAACWWSSMGKFEQDTHNARVFDRGEFTRKHINEFQEKKIETEEYKPEPPLYKPAKRVAKLKPIPPLGFRVCGFRNCNEFIKIEVRKCRPKKYCCDNHRFKEQYYRFWERRRNKSGEPRRFKYEDV